MDFLSVDRLQKNQCSTGCPIFLSILERQNKIRKHCILIFFFKLLLKHITLLQFPNIHFWSNFICFLDYKNSDIFFEQNFGLNKNPDFCRFSLDLCILWINISNFKYLYLTIKQDLKPDNHSTKLGSKSWNLRNLRGI